MLQDSTQTVPASQPETLEGRLEEPDYGFRYNEMIARKELERQTPVIGTEYKQGYNYGWIDGFGNGASLGASVITLASLGAIYFISKRFSITKKY